jgi:NitT/TauT family transport system permease protein
MKLKAGRTRLKKYGIKIAAVCFWLLVWEVLDLVIHEDILLASPFAVFVTLLGLIRTLDFWHTIFFSFGRIVLGFVLAITTGTILAVLSYLSVVIKELISPLIKIMKSIPVASFIILALVWIRATNVSVLISFLMVLPVIYLNVWQGLNAADEKLLQMAAVFHIGRIKKIKAIYIPTVIPYFVSAISIGLGFCWKSGIAAEIIGYPSGSIGLRLYEAKLNLMTKELLAWTVVIVIISILFEKAVMWLIKLLQKDYSDKIHNA